MKSFAEHANLPEIYCDMDGVLADFHKAIDLLYGKHDPMTQLSDEITSDLTVAHSNFFATLPWMRDGKALWKFISKFKPNILSAAPQGWLPNAIPDKKIWIARHLRPAPQQIFIGKRSEKRNYATKAGTANILIDDYYRNIKDWTAAGGIGIHHTSTANTIVELKKLGF